MDETILKPPNVSVNPPKQTPGSIAAVEHPNPIDRNNPFRPADLSKLEKPKKSRKKKLRVLVIISIILFTLSILFMFTIRLFKKQKQQSPLSSISTFNIDEPEKDNDQKETYRSSNGRFEMQHPKLKINQCDLSALNDLGLGEQEVVLSQGANNTNEYFCGAYSFAIFIDHNNKSTIEEKIKSFEDSLEEPGVRVYPLSPDLSQVGNTVGKIVSIRKTGEKFTRTIYFFEDPVSRNVYSIYSASVYGSDASTGLYSLDYFKDDIVDILKSFKLYNENEVAYPEWTPINIEEEKIWYIETKGNNRYLKKTIPKKHPSISSYSFNRNPPIITSSINLLLNTDGCQVYMSGQISPGHGTYPLYKPIYKAKKIGSIIVQMDIFDSQLFGTENGYFLGVVAKPEASDLETVISTKSYNGEFNLACLNDVENLLSTLEIEEITEKEYKFIETEQYRIGRQ